MSKVADVVTLLFNPIFIIGVARFYKIFDSIREFHYGTGNFLWIPEFNLPVICCLFTLSSSVLSHEANKRFLTINPGVRTSSLSGLFAFATAGCILIMFYFTTDAKTLSLWVGTYAFLCFFNAAWNFVAVTPETRKPYVYGNLLLFIFLFAASAFLHKPLQPLHMYAILAIIFLIKTWQRSKPREFRLQNT